jgi:hypothetical protein
VPKPEKVTVAPDNGVSANDSANAAMFTLRTLLDGDAQGNALLDSLDSYWWKRRCQPQPTAVKTGATENKAIVAEFVEAK